jgi:hypothetical protein
MVIASWDDVVKAWGASPIKREFRLVLAAQARDA